MLTLLNTVGCVWTTCPFRLSMMYSRSSLEMRRCSAGVLVVRSIHSIIVIVDIIATHHTDTPWNPQCYDSSTTVRSPWWNVAVQKHGPPSEIIIDKIIIAKFLYGWSHTSTKNCRKFRLTDAAVIWEKTSKYLPKTHITHFLQVFLSWT